MERGKPSGAAQDNSNYNIRPPFKDKFRAAEAKTVIEQLVPDIVLKHSGQPLVVDGVAVDPKHELSKELSQAVNQALRELKKDERYKFVVQVSVGENNGQGVRVSSRCYWDEDTDDVAFVSFVNDKFFVLVCAFAVYLY